jgi:hypothetical protein
MRRIPIVNGYNILGISPLLPFRHGSSYIFEVSNPEEHEFYRKIVYTCVSRSPMPALVQCAEVVQLEVLCRLPTRGRR